MKKIIGVHQLVLGSNAAEIMEFFKATDYTTPPMRAITGIKFPDGTICKYGEWILQYEDDSYSVITNNLLQNSLVCPPADDNYPSLSATDIIRSALSIAQRKGEQTNWEGFHMQCQNYFNKLSTPSLSEDQITKMAEERYPLFIQLQQAFISGYTARTI